MKWVLLFAACAAVLPLSAWLRQNPREALKVWTLVGFLVVEHGPLHVYMALDSWAGQWPGYTLGAEISLLDLIVLAIYFTLPRSRHSLPFLFSIGFYLFAATISVFQASVPQAALFYSWQLARVFFVYAVITRACAADERVIGALLKGIALGMFLAAGQAVWQRFGAGVVQVAGGFPHQNFLGMVSHFIVYPFFALLLAGERGWFPIAVSVVGAIVYPHRIARHGSNRRFWLCCGLLLSAARGWSSRKSMALVAAVFAAIALSPLVVSSFEQRFSSSSDLQSSVFEGDLTRDQMEDAARAMLADHPMGIGANHYVAAANNLGYNQKSGLTWQITAPMSITPTCSSRLKPDILVSPLLRFCFCVH